MKQPVSSTVVSGPRVLDFFQQHLLALDSQMSYQMLNAWMKALVHLQKAQLMVMLLDHTTFGHQQNIRQFMPVMGLLANTSVREHNRKAGLYLDHGRLNSGYDVTDMRGMTDFLMMVG